MSTDGQPKAPRTWRPVFNDRVSRLQLSPMRSGCRLACDKLLERGEGTITREEYMRRAA